VFNPDQVDSDGDLEGDACDADDDNDGVDDVADPAPLDPGVCGDSDADTCDDCAGAFLVLVEAEFETDPEGFEYVDDAFRGTSEPAYADGTYEANGGFENGGLRVLLGGIDENDVYGMSGGWRIEFELETSSELTLSFLYNLTQSATYESDEFSQVLLSVDGTLVGRDSDDYVDQIVGDGNSGPAQSTGWQSFQADLETVSAGVHVIVLGGYNNKKTTSSEWTEISIDQVTLVGTSPSGFDPLHDGPDFDGDGLCDAGDPDDDDDGVDDMADSDPFDPFACRDADGDGCDDCSGGTDDPANDGDDTDSDGACDAGDDDDDNDGVNDPDDPAPLDPDVCGDTDGDGCDDCSIGTDDLGPLADADPANDGDDFDADGACDAGDADDDNDGVQDVSDLDPLNPYVCEDVDGDTCDDCSVGTDGTGPLPDNDPTADGDDTDSDGSCDAGDADDDNDGVGDGSDPSPLDPDICGDVDADGCDDCSVGTDDYGPLADNDPANDGDDFDSDGACDAGDPDDDNDHVDDPYDADPFNPYVCRDADEDGCDDCSSGIDDPMNDGDDNDDDGLCDAGDPDDDDDGIPDGEDNCPFTPNVEQSDEDDDGIGDACDLCLGDPFNDYDSDGLCTSEDNCPSVPNPDQQDENGDGIGDACEVVPVGLQFRIAATEVTNGQYARFLNAVAKSDPHGLFNPNMGTHPRGGIVRLPGPGGFVYSTRPHMANKPVNFVSWLDAARYVNWLHNGKPTGPPGAGTTESGAYALFIPDPAHNAVRQPGATWFLPTVNEWSLAAYVDPTRPQPWTYPTRSNEDPTGAAAHPNGDVANPGIDVANYNNSAKWNEQDGNVTTVAGCGTLSTSYWGTYDQGGNVAEWIETSAPGGNRHIRGGSYRSKARELTHTGGAVVDPLIEVPDVGIRVAGPL
jgi:formylglycine-generating enzyme required for sulfatase activity